MSIDAMVLRAMLRLARRREAAIEEQITLRVGGTRGEVRASLRRLEAEGLIERQTAQGCRLTMSGLAVSVALLPTAGARTARVAQRKSHAA
jgi:Mn-dependent DtxR family transcriptional regulator